MKSFILQTDSRPRPPSASSLLKESIDSGTTSARSSYYLAIVRPTSVTKPGRWNIPIVSSPDPERILQALNSVIENDKLFAIDLETRGLQPFRPESVIVGVGLSSKRGTIYLDTRAWTDASWELLFEFLEVPDFAFVGHNLMFDASWLEFYSRRIRGISLAVAWVGDTYALYRQLANEGHPVQQGGVYSLKEAQTDLLGWETRGDEELSEWLVTNGFYKNPKSYKEATPEERNRLYHEGKLKADKGAMWNAPPEVLGYYCGLDAYSTLKLYTHVFRPSVEIHPWSERFWLYHETFITNLRVLVEQYLEGILVDRARLETWYETLSGQVSQAKNDFITAPRISGPLAEYRSRRIQALRALEPAKYLKVKPLGEEPPRLTKSGDVSKNWERWQKRKEDLAAGKLHKVSGAWTDWQTRLAKLADDELFNLNSTPLRQWLFYEALGYQVVTRTAKGNPETGKKALRAWGEEGKLLRRYNDLEKERQMVASCLGVLVEQSEAWRLHPSFKAPGTHTGRLAGGSVEGTGGTGRFNIQQIPKRKEYLSCWIPAPGNVFVDCDHMALEPVVLAALSRDPAMLELYGPGAKLNDIYLYVGANLPGVGKVIREAGYDPRNPTKVGIDSAKKDAKKERAIAKILVLGCQYGMGPKKLRLTLELEGIPCDEEDAFRLWCGYWNVFRGIRDYGKRLEKLWGANSGWVLNGLGRPVCCSADMLKDLVNRVVQSTGHDVHMLFVEELERLRVDTGLEFSWIISDFHDQSIVEVREEDAAGMVELYNEAYRRLGARIKVLNPEFRLEIKGVPAVIPSLAEAKIQE